MRNRKLRMEKKMRSILCSLLLILLLLAPAAPAGAQASQSTPGPSAAELQTHDKIGYMATVPPDSFRLWPGDAPGALGQRAEDIPTLTLLPPDPAKANGAA